MLTIVDFLLVMQVGYFLGNYLALSIVALISGIGLFIFNKTMNANINTIRDYHLIGYSEEPFLMFIGSMPSAILILIPGLITTFIGLILLIPSIRKQLGTMLSKHLQIDWNEIHEYFYILYK
ncbi:MAG: FxsA family protein [Bacteroidales bacterium]|nr:FxsA family protein [Bacteroidales bacterium]